MTSTSQLTGDDLRAVKRALISVSDKDGALELAKALHDRGVSIISTGGTAKMLSEAGVPVTPVEEVTGAPEMLDGRVKTLHPAVHGAILADRDTPAHNEALARHAIEPIDLICVNLYPFEETIAREGVTRAEAIENIDIGGPTMIRAAAKNHASVAVLTSPEQYRPLLDELQANDGSTTRAFRERCAKTAFARTAAYDAAIAAYLREGETDLPAMLTLRGDKAADLRYGENPHQRAGVYRDRGDRGTSIIDAKQLHGKALSYNNVSDADRALRIVQDLKAAFPGMHGATVIKHTNPCGGAIATSSHDAIGATLEGDPLAAYGGILCANTPITEASAETILEEARFLEVIAAPAFEERSAEMIGERWANVRLLELDEITEPSPALDFRPIRGGMLVQDQDTKAVDTGSWTLAAGPDPGEELTRGAAFAWLMVKHLTSNAIAIARLDPTRASTVMLTGSGAGQMDRVASCRIALSKMGSPTTGTSVAASDAFFPFPDGPEMLISGGVTLIVHPGGSKRDHETMELCERCGVTCFTTGVRHFRH
jgi:phosphoribosylaminoimidazolecarboxamide formyltransferase/IMP cyclohydrolase